MRARRPAARFSRPQYYRRLLSNYLISKSSHLDFWHEVPEVNPNAIYRELGPYYMCFRGKAAYLGPFDASGVPMLHYGGSIGLQYNPIAVAQYGLAHYNLFAETEEPHHREVFLRQAAWLAENLEPNRFGVPVWAHHFDWDYADGLEAPWYSGLAQGAALSCLARAAALERTEQYKTALSDGFASFRKDVNEGGVCLAGPEGEVWIEEYLVERPSHVLNGLLWALWGVWDYFLYTGDEAAESLFQACVGTLKRNLSRYDTASWSLYELAPYKLSNIASGYYHSLHIVQLRVMYSMTGEPVFREYAEEWSRYRSRLRNRWQSRFYKTLFKLFHY